MGPKVSPSLFGPRGLCLYNSNLAQKYGHSVWHLQGKQNFWQTEILPLWAMKKQFRSTKGRPFFCPVINIERHRYCCAFLHPSPKLYFKIWNVQLQIFAYKNSANDMCDIIKVKVCMSHIPSCCNYLLNRFRWNCRLSIPGLIQICFLDWYFISR